MLLELRGCTLLLTAGHNLKNIEQALQNDGFEILKAVLDDTFGLNPVSNIPIPFDLKGSSVFYVTTKTTAWILA
jgi:hypothetical protein